MESGLVVAGWLPLVGESAAGWAVGAELVARWGERHRRYHTLEHLRAVLAAIDALAAEASDPVSVRLAAWFHDAVYAGGPGWDEERSAQLAQAMLPRCGVSRERVAETARLVRLTVSHDPADDDANGAVLCDADLAILAGFPPRHAHDAHDVYGGYARAVREEYRHVPDEAFRVGRAAVLRRLLSAPFLYRTPKGRELWEAAARANVTAELAALA